MPYKDVLTNTMTSISRNSRVKFIGYNTKYGHQMYGTLAGCEHSCVETPVAENLMCGLAMGMSLEGYKPILCFERSNFLLGCLDAIINHMYLLPKISGYQFNFPVILRVIVPNKSPLDPGLQHTGDYTYIIDRYTNIWMERLYRAENIERVYTEALERNASTCIVEYKELYGI